MRDIFKIFLCSSILFLGVGNYKKNENGLVKKIKQEKIENANSKIKNFFYFYDPSIYEDVLNNIEKNEKKIKYEINIKEKKLKKYETIIEKFCDEDWKKYLIKALIIVESGVNEKAKSKKGALGLMQLTSSTIKKYYKNSNPYKIAYDPEKNIEVGIKEIERLIEKYNSIHLALAAYNCGETRLRKIIKKYGKDWHEIKYKLPKETRNYVIKVLSRYSIMSDLYLQFGKYF